MHFHSQAGFPTRAESPRLAVNAKDPRPEPRAITDAGWSGQLLTPTPPRRDLHAPPDGQGPARPAPRTRHGPWRTPSRSTPSPVPPIMRPADRSRLPTVRLPPLLAFT